MAIRINSSVPQQQTANPASFGAIQGYKSALSGLQVADTGRGIGQAAQGLANLSNHVRKKEEELANRNANKAVTNYGIALQEAGEAYQDAIRSRNPERITETESAFNMLDPENKDFSFNNFADSPVDEKYYARYEGQVRLGYSQNKTSYGNLNTELSLFETEEEGIAEAQQAYYKFKLDPTNNALLNSVVSLAITGGNNVSDNFTERSTKPALQQKYSNILKRVFESKFATAKNIQELNGMRKELYEDLVNDDWNFFQHEEQINTAYTNIAKNLTADDGVAQKTNAKNSLAMGRNELYTAIDVIADIGFGKKDTWMPLVSKSADFLAEIARTDPLDPNSAPMYLEDATDINNFNSAIALLGLLQDVPATGTAGPLREEFYVTPFQADVLEYTRFKNLPSDFPPEMVQADRDKYREIIKSVGDDIKDDLKYRDSARAYKTLYGDQGEKEDVEFAMEEIFGVKSRGITLFSPNTDMPKNWWKDRELTVNHLVELFGTNDTGDIANFVAMSLQSGKSTELEYEQLALIDTVNRAILHNNIDSKNPQVVGNFVMEQVEKFSALYEQGTLVTEGSKSEIQYKELRQLDSEQDDQYRLEIFKQLDSPHVQAQPGLRKFYSLVAKGFVHQMVVDPRKPLEEGFLVGDRDRMFNFMAERDKMLFADNTGILAKSTNGTPVLIFGGLTEDVYEGGKRRKVLGIQGITRFFQRFQEFRNLFRQQGDPSDIDRIDPKFLQREIGDAIVQGVMFDLSEMGVNYRQEIDMEKFKDSDLLDRFKLQEKILKEYERGERSKSEIFEMLMNSNDFVLDQIGKDKETGELGLIVQYTDDNNKLHTYIKPNGEDYVIPYSKLIKLANINLDIRVRNLFQTVEDPSMITQPGILNRRVTNRTFYDKAKEATK